MTHFTDRERAFVIELEALTRKHKIAITGCGCCGSPSLASFEGDIPPEAGYGSTECDLHWIEGKDDYYYKQYSTTIVKELK